MEILIALMVLAVTIVVTAPIYLILSIGRKYPPDEKILES